MSVAGIDYGGMVGAVWLAEKACLAWCRIRGDTEAAEGAMAAECDDYAMGWSGSKDKAAELGAERGMQEGCDTAGA